MDLAEPGGAGCRFGQRVDEESHQICLGNVTHGVEAFLSLGAMSPGLPHHGSLSFPARQHPAGRSAEWKVGSAGVSERVPEGTAGWAGRR